MKQFKFSCLAVTAFDKQLSVQITLSNRHNLYKGEIPPNVEEIRSQKL